MRPVSRPLRAGTLILVTWSHILQAMRYLPWLYHSCQLLDHEEFIIIPLIPLLYSNRREIV